MASSQGAQHTKERPQEPQPEDGGCAVADAQGKPLPGRYPEAMRAFVAVCCSVLQSVAVTGSEESLLNLSYHLALFDRFRTKILGSLPIIMT